MRILQVSMMDRGGGAERVALDLLRAYQNLGHESRLAVGYKEGHEKDIVLIPNRDNLPRWGKFCARLAAPLETLFGVVPGAGRLHDLLLNRLGQPQKTISWWRGYEDYESPGTARILELMTPPPDVLHCHNLHRGYFDLRWLPELSRRVRVVLTLHDEWLFTGHCAHSFACGRWRNGCGACPSLGTYPPIRQDGSRTNWETKRDILSRSNVHIVTPSQWLMDRVKESPILGGKTLKTVINNGIDLGTFCPTGQAPARERLGLSQSERIVVFAHPNAKTSQFKDYDTFIRCAHRLAEDHHDGNLLFLVIGPNLPEQTIGNARIRFVSRVTERRQMSDYYNSADVYIHPAKAENFPLAILEAMACGTPIVASRIGGIPEQVVDGENGFLVEIGDWRSMAIYIRKILSDSEMRLRMAANAARRAKHLYGLDLAARRYLEIFGASADDAHVEKAPL